MFEKNSLWAPAKGIVISKSGCEMQAKPYNKHFCVKNHANPFWG